MHSLSVCVSECVCVCVCVCVRAIRLEQLLNFGGGVLTTHLNKEKQCLRSIVKGQVTPAANVCMERHLLQNQEVE